MNEEIRRKLGVEENKPTEWFEQLYSSTSETGQGVPWANMTPHPMFKNWIDNNPVNGEKQTALVVGCGMGDDAIELEEKGFTVTAFDVSHSAIELCKKRFPNSKVDFLQADLIKGIPEWKQKFDFVLEIFTIQALPPKYENLLIENISDFVSKEGKLVLITEVQKAERDFKNGPPWLLNYDYPKSFLNFGLTQIEQFNSSETEMGEEIHLTIFEKNNNIKLMI